MLLVNYKTYKESSGEKAVFLTKALVGVAGATGVACVACPQLVDLNKVLLESGGVEVWTQHVDPNVRGRATGWFPAEIAKEAGAMGTILNHAEHKLSVSVLEKIVIQCKDIGLKTLIFADSLEEAQKVAELKPDWIAYEPPELVGSSETSVSKSKPEVIQKVVESIPDIAVLVGAGVKDRSDVEVAIKLGARGIGVSSGVVKADNQKQALLDLAEGMI